MGNNVYGAIALKTSAGALDLIDGINLLSGDIALVVTDTNSYFYKLFTNDVSQENSPYIIKPVLNGSNKRWRLTSISETSGDLSVIGKLITNMISFSGSTLTVITGTDTLATFNKETSSVSFKRISSVESTQMVNNLNAQYVGGRDGTKMMLSDGSISFEAPVSGSTPTSPSHLATKSYVDTLIANIDNSTATNFTVNNLLTSSTITSKASEDLILKRSGTTVATFGSNGVSFAKISSVSDNSMVNGLNAEFIRGTTLDGLIKADGSISFTNTISGVTPTANAHLATKAYVDTSPGKAASGNNYDITSLNGLTIPLSIAQGGTGAVTIAGIKSALGLTNAVSYDIVNAFTKQQYATPIILTGQSGNISIDADLHQDIDITATGNITFLAPLNAVRGKTLFVTLYATSAYTITWNAVYLSNNDVTLDTAFVANKKLYLQFRCIDGTNWVLMGRVQGA